ncbi:hypothetical protein M8998_04845 [Sphingobacterium sp. lm-10]|uniref:hypothetical protein n=1 Tax=Sphingobacterium sp. lm-10 TaxID=2944904 RepID=UPI00202225CF|nr:hypothetical protein [Sphingobacterium sp. lm-10]MCL7987266.1 hypothetical protein [Sphingobacterium sp. lm-10]
MKKFTLLLLLSCLSLGVFAQRHFVKTDIFGNLTYRSDDGSYQATLKKNIFDDLVFSDNRRNEITYEKKYLLEQYPGILTNSNKQQHVFIDLIRENRRSENYTAKYRIDIFDKLIIEDNRGYKLEQGTDIFGSIQRNEQVNGVNTKLHKTLNGTWEFIEGKDKASLTNDIFNRRIYSDSFGNEIEFQAKSWQRLVNRYATEEDAFMSLVDQFFYP